MKFFKIIFGLFLILVIAYIVFLLLDKKDVSNAPVACTQEAMLCPDGSYVGRTGPRCEFAPCPTQEEPVVPPQNNADVWNTSTNKQEGITFLAPQSLGTEYIHLIEWPPEVEVADVPFTCKESGSVVMPEGKTTQKNIENISYCVTEESEGAAGSIYTKYIYAFAKDAQTVRFSFTLRAVQCGNYDEDKKSACESERASFDIDALSDKIAKTIRVE